MNDPAPTPHAGDAAAPDAAHPAAEAAFLAAAARAGLDRLARRGHRRAERPAAASPQAPPVAANPDQGEAPRPGGKTGGGAGGRAPEGENRPGRPADRNPAPNADPVPASVPPAAVSRPAASGSAASGSVPSGAAAPGARPPALDEARIDALARTLSDRAAAAFRERVAGVAARAAAARDLEELREGVASCTACRLCETRTQTVFADGSAAARVMFVGEGPGADEDASGVPFVGAAGRMLTDIIEKGMRLDRANDVYIANVVKCRPPGNRDPSPHEKAICAPWLARQIEFVDPAVLVPLGKHAAQALLAREDSLGRLRGAVHAVGGRRVVATYHPSWLLRQKDDERPAAKRKVWEDIRRAMAELERGEG